MTDPLAEAEFSRWVEAARIGPEGLDLTVEATEEERRRVAARLGILAVEALAGSIRLVPAPDSGAVRLSARLHAAVVQACVVSLEPVRNEIDLTFERVYRAGAAPAAAGRKEVWVDPEVEEPPEPLVDGSIDVGEAMVEELALALDPYPRKPGAELPAGWEERAGAGERESPFAALAKLSKRP
jgi:uncharacterized metal-binding protein YceD (DUF177 family)